MTKMHYSPNLARLAPCTSEKCPFEHFDPLLMKRMAPAQGIGVLKTLKNSYEAIEVRPYEIAPALNQLRSAMSKGLFERVVTKKSERDGADRYHLTIISPAEYRKLRKEGKSIERTKPFHYNIVGVGTASDDSSQTWFAVVNSVAIDHYRYSLGLPRKDLHITLGFTEKDVHNVKKDEATLI